MTSQHTPQSKFEDKEIKNIRAKPKIQTAEGWKRTHLKPKPTTIK